MLLAWGFKSDRNKNDASVQMRRPYFLPIKRQVFNNIISVVYHTDRFQFGWEYNTVVENCQKVSLIQGVRELFVAVLVWQFPIWFWSHLLLSGFSQLDYKVWSLFHSKIYLCQAHISLFQMWHDTLIAYKCSSAQWNFLKLRTSWQKGFFIAINQLSLNF